MQCGIQQDIIHDDAEEIRHTSEERSLGYITLIHPKIPKSEVKKSLEYTEEISFKERELLYHY
jgi:tryptophan synthase alpha subunit